MVQKKVESYRIWKTSKFVKTMFDVKLIVITNSPFIFIQRAVMDTAINLLAGGLHVRVLHEGQKIADENTTLAQMGVTCQESLDSLEFMLEPNCSHNALMKLEDPLPSLSNVTDKPTKSR